MVAFGYANVRPHKSSHVLVNMYSLWIVGPYVEKLYGSAKFIVLWVVTGVGGVGGELSDSG